MPPPAAPQTKNVVAQRNFSAGELDISIKRNDEHPLMKAGGRQMSNWRILNSHAITNRPGRRALFLASGRTDKVLMSPGNIFYLNFGGGGVLTVYDNTGVKVFGTTGFAWGLTTVKNVVWAQTTGLQIYITFPGQVPKILTWDGASTWSVTDYAVQTIGTQRRTFFYRLAPKGITLTLGGTSGSVSLTFSASVLVAGMVGTYIRFQNSQILITAVSSGTVGTGTIVQAINSNSEHLVVNTTVGFAVGDLIAQSTTGARGTITAIGAGTIDVTLITAAVFTGTGFIVNGRGGYCVLTSTGFNAPAASVLWDQEVINAFQGWPQSCFFDQGRLGFCNIPAIPGAIIWSAVSQYDDLYPDAFADDGLATDCIVEIMPNKSQVLFVVPGMESNEFVFCDNRIYWIPISVTNPLKPGSVQVNEISVDGAWPVQPRRVDESMAYIKAGGLSVRAVIATGSYSRPYETADLSENHTHLIKSPIAIATTYASGTFPEKYLYIVNNDGTLAVGKYTIKQGALHDVAGWVPWSGAGTITWLATLNADVAFTTSYAPNGIAAVSLVEIQDDSRYLDASQLYITQPVGLLPPAGGGRGNDSFTKILLHMDGADASTTFTDVALGLSHTWTPAGDAQIDTAQSKFGGASGLFDGTGDWITTPDSADYTLGALDWTVDCWFNVNGGAGTFRWICGQGDQVSNTTRSVLLLLSTTNQMIGAACVGSSIFQISSTTAFTSPGWHHVAFVRTGNSLKLFIDGVQEGGTLSIFGAVNDSSTVFAVGKEGSAAVNSWNGWIDEFRLSVGVARWTSNFTPPTAAYGNGALWYLIGGSVDLMDGPLGTRMMGTYLIDADGYVIPQGNAGEDLTSGNLRVGQTWTATWEPFVPGVGPGEDRNQRLRKRRVQRVDHFVQNSSGFLMQRLYGEQSGPNLPVAGTVMKQRRIPTWNIGEDPTQPPVLRERSYLDRPLGRFFDPRVALVKDTPGPITLLETNLEVTS